MSHIIHDWDEDQCPTILGHVRKAMNPAGRVFIVEMVLPHGDTAHPGKMLDMTMLVLLGGQERTESEYASLLSMASLRLTQVVPTNSRMLVDVRFKSDSDIAALLRDVRSAPKSGLRQAAPACPKSAQ